MEENIYEEGMVVQVVGENKFIHQKKINHDGKDC